jgi:hypothetical protein
MANCWPTTFMNRLAPCTLVVPKSAQAWPLMASSAAGACAVLRPASAFSTLPKSPVALPVALPEA